MLRKKFFYCFVGLYTVHKNTCFANYRNASNCDPKEHRLYGLLLLLIVFVCLEHSWPRQPRVFPLLDFEPVVSEAGRTDKQPEWRLESVRLSSVLARCVVHHLLIKRSLGSAKTPLSVFYIFVKHTFWQPLDFD